MTKQTPLYVLTVVIFIILLLWGFFLAAHKPLWCDEIYSQLGSVERPGYFQIFSGGIEEGNNSPLFYSLQKVIGKALHYRSPKEWYQGQEGWKVSRPVDKMVLRIQPVVCMSLAITAIFYFFSRYYSFGSGFFSLFLSLSSAMLWRFWAEARPYALWVMLTTFQILIFLYLCREKKINRKVWLTLILVHFLLSFTVILSLAQIFLVSVLLMVFVHRRWRDYLLLTLLPVLICLSYYYMAPKYKFWVMFSYEQYIRAGISRDRLYILYLFMVAIVLFYLQKGTRYLKIYTDDTLQTGWPYLLMTLGMIASTCLIVFFFKLMEPPGQQGFPVTNRYFINLAPVGIIATTLFTTLLIKSFRERPWVQWCLGCGIVGLIVQKLFKIIPDIQGHYPQLFS